MDLDRNDNPTVRITVGDLLDVADLFERIWKDPVAGPLVDELFAWIPPGQNDTMDLIRGETSMIETTVVGTEDLYWFFRACTE